MFSQQRSFHSSEDDSSHGAIDIWIHRGIEENDHELTVDCPFRPPPARQLLEEKSKSSAIVAQVQNHTKRPRSPSLEESKKVVETPRYVAGAGVSQNKDCNCRNNKKKTTSAVLSSIRTQEEETPSLHATALSLIEAGPNYPVSILQHRWNNMFERLETFKANYGHCLVPNRYDEDASLGAWVSAQRQHYKTMIAGRDGVTTPLTAERVQRLEGIGFVWATSDPRNTPWRIRFEQLREYQEKFGNCLVPIGYKDNVKLANWVSAQRKDFRSFKEGRRQITKMRLDRIQLLTSIGMIWNAKRTGNHYRGRYRPISYNADTDQHSEEESEHDGRNTPAPTPNDRIDSLASMLRQHHHYEAGPAGSRLVRNAGTSVGTHGSLGATSFSTPSGFALSTALAASSRSHLPPRPSVAYSNVSSIGDTGATAGQLQQGLVLSGIAPRGESVRGVHSSSSSPGTASSSLWPIEAEMLSQRMPSSSLQQQQQARLDNVAGGSLTSENLIATHLYPSNAAAMIVAARMGGDPTVLRAGLTQSSLRTAVNSEIDALASRLLLLQQTSELAASASPASSENNHLFADHYLANTLNPLVAGLPSSHDTSTHASMLHQYPFAGGLSSTMEATISPAALLASASQQSTPGTMAGGLGINSGVLNYQAGLGTSGVSTSATAAQSHLSASPLQLLLLANSSQGLSRGYGEGTGTTHLMRNTSYYG